MSISLHPDAPQDRALVAAEQAAGVVPDAKPSGGKIRSRLFTKYVGLFVVVVGAALLSNGIFEVFFYYREHKASLIRIQHEQAEAAAAKIGQFIKEIESQLGWTTQLPWSAGSIEQRRFDALRLLRQVPAITELAQLDSTGKERLRVSRLAMDVVDSGIDLSKDPKFTEAVAHKVYYGPVYFRRESEPYMTLALAGTRKDAGVSIAEVNLKLIWDVVSQIRVGERGHAYVVGPGGRLIAHPDISLVLRNTDMSKLAQVQAAQAGNTGAGGESLEGTKNIQGQEVLTASAPISPLGWTMFVELPVEEAYASLYAALQRLALVLAVASLFAVLAGIFLARRMVGPIQALRAGAERMGSGDFAQHISIKTGDELEGLANQFNEMGARLQESYADLENKVEQRTAELSESLQQQTATADVLKVISRSVFDLQTVLETLIKSAVELSRANRGSIFLREGDVFPLKAASSTTPEFLQYWAANPPKAGRGSTTSRVIASGKVEAIPDVLDDPEMEMPAGSLIRIRSALGVPLLRNGKVEGVLVLTRPEPGPFTKSQIDLMQTFADQAMIAIENARLFNETQEALERQTATSDILKVIASSPSDVQPVFDAIASSAKALIGGFSATVARIVGDTLHLAAFTPTTTKADEALQASFPIPLAEFPPFGSARGGETVQFIDTEAEGVPVRNREVARLRGYRSMLFTPLMNNGKPIGMISVTCKEPGTFAEHHVKLLQTFADQAVIAIENVRLFDEVQAKTADLSESLLQQTATADVLKVISRSVFDLQTVLDTLVDAAYNLCGANVGLLYLRGEEAFECKAIAGVGVTEASRLFKGRPIRAGRGTAAERVILTGEVQSITNFLEDPEMDPKIRDAILNANSSDSSIGQIRSTLAVPMTRDNAVIGVMVIGCSQTGSFPQRQIELLQTFADQAVIAIENARLFDEVQARTRDLTDSLQQQTATADVLKVISRSAFDLKSVLATLVASAAKLCEAEKGVIFLREEDNYRLVSNHGFSPEFETFARANPFPADGGSTTTRAAESGGVVQVVDVLEDGSRSALAREYQRLGGYRTNLGVPLMREGETIGVFTLTRQEVRAFTPRQVELVETFADQAVIAIENVRLFDEVQARTRELSLSLEELGTAQDRLVQTEKLASLGQLTAGIAHEIKNPLNFVNNFSALSAELIDELNDVLKPAALDDKVRDEIDELTQMLKGNLEKVVQHGKRADSIVKNMLLHSREGSGEHRPADINAIVEESLNLAYHGARAEKPGFNITLQRDLDPKAGMIDLYPQEITRVFLNLISNGFYAAAKRKEAGEEGFEPVLSATTKNFGNRVEIRIRDNGTGIPQEVKEKMFNPFFTTKPAGEGTGLGLSMSHDIVVKQHGGRIDVDTKPGEFTEFIISLPRTAVAPAKTGSEN